MRHDHLHTALESLERALLAGDAFASEEEMKKTLELFAATDHPAGDERLKPLSDRCERLAIELRNKLEVEVRSSAASRRATSAYGGGNR